MARRSADVSAIRELSREGNLRKAEMKIRQAETVERQAENYPRGPQKEHVLGIAKRYRQESAQLRAEARP